MRSRRQVPAAVVAALAATWAGVASAEPALVRGTWREDGREATVSLRQDGPRRWSGAAVSPDGRPARLRLLERAGAFTLQVRLDRAPETPGIVGGLEGDAERPADDRGPRGPESRRVSLAREGTCLVGGGFRLSLAPAGDPAGGDGADSGAAPIDRPLGETEARPRPVRVLITGFDKFPRPRNHPHWVSRGAPERDREPKVNPAGWAVRNFDPATLDAALQLEAPIEVNRLNDVPVVYVEGARAVTDQIERVDADVAISFGVGSDGDVDGDVESVCFNRMSDGWSASGDQDPGPFQLPADWPPRGDPSTWSEADRVWRWRYPDNAGVSYANAPIDPAAPERLGSSLPVAQIVASVERRRLRAHDGAGGPGQYICNNVMFRVVQVQAARGRIGGFVHLAQWSEARRDAYLTVVRCAIEESVRAVLAARAAEAAGAAESTAGR